MRYRLKLKESLVRGVQRIALEQLDKVLSAPSRAGDRRSWVHETRKSIKRVRALLRLVRSGLGDATWREQNARLRHVARMLSPMRDDDVLGQISHRLAETADARLAAALSAFDTSRQEVALPASSDPALAEATLGEAHTQLRHARKCLSGLAVAGEVVDIAGTGLATAVRAGRRALSAVQSDPTDERWHELRKAVQVYWRQIVLLEAAWPEIQHARAETARELSQILGEMQDLAVLAAAAREWDSTTHPGAKARRIVAGCRDRQQQLADVALPGTARLFALPPKAVAAEFRGCWSAAIARSAANGVVASSDAAAEGAKASATTGQSKHRLKASPTGASGMAAPPRRRGMRKRSGFKAR